MLQSPLSYAAVFVVKGKEQERFAFGECEFISQAPMIQEIVYRRYKISFYHLRGGVAQLVRAQDS